MRSRAGKVAIVVNTTMGAKEVRDSYALRRQTPAPEHSVTSRRIAAAVAACDAIEAQREGTLRVKSPLHREWNAAD